MEGDLLMMTGSPRTTAISQETSPRPVNTGAWTGLAHHFQALEALEVLELGDVDFCEMYHRGM